MTDDTETETTAPNRAQVRLRSETTLHRMPACSLLYLSIPRSMGQALAYTDLASLVLPILASFTSPITISPHRSTRLRNHLCNASRR